MRDLLDDLDPIFMAAAVMIGGLTLASRMPEPPIFLDHPSLEGIVVPKSAKPPLPDFS
jgi:hypothetical protein